VKCKKLKIPAITISFSEVKIVDGLPEFVDGLPEKRKNRKRDRQK